MKITIRKLDSSWVGVLATLVTGSRYEAYASTAQFTASRESALDLDPTIMFPVFNRLADGSLRMFYVSDGEHVLILADGRTEHSISVKGRITGGRFETCG